MAAFYITAGIFLTSAAVVGLVMALARRPDDAATLAAPGLEELRRATASWAPEPELASAAIPRPVRLKPPFFRLGWLFAALIAFFGLTTLLTAPTLYQRPFVFRKGLAAKGAVLNEVRVRHHSRHNTYFETRLEISYPDESGNSRTMTAMAGDNPPLSVGQTVALHFLPSGPRWAALDDDFGYSAGKLGEFFVAAATVLMIPALVLMIAGPGLRRERALLRDGRAFGARIAAVKPLGKGAVRISFHYAADGQVRSGTCSAGRGGNLRPGDVVTVLADPESSRGATIYGLSSWKVDAESVK